MDRTHHGRGAGDCQYRRVQQDTLSSLAVWLGPRLTGLAVSHMVMPQHH